ncbi:MBL fold metallo-hydrolase [Desulforudis sp. 1088]|uniref:MBL fold metallo-hydrolase n=1 Tax=unclassified Candidatus Desulforudis TaxID=2635950 RepID=UPI0034891561
MALELIHLKGKTSYIKGAVNVGVYDRGDGKCILVDSGLDESSGRQLLRCLEGANLTPCAVINTHSHADHFGANKFVRNRTGARFWATSFEKAVIENPLLEPVFLFSAVPVKEMRTKFLMGQPCPVDHVLSAGRQEIAGISMEIVDLAGHAPEQVGVVTPDDVFFAADAFVSGDIVEKYRLPYMADLVAAKESLRRVGSMSHSWVVPSHGRPTRDPGADIAVNLRKITETEALILKLAGEGATRETIFSGVVEAYGINLGPEQYVLVFATVSAYLAGLCAEGRLRMRFAGPQLLWAADC